MKIRDYTLKKIQMGAKFSEDEKYRVIIKSVMGLIFNLFFTLYNGIVGIISNSTVFLSSSVCCFLLGLMRFCAVISEQKSNKKHTTDIIGILHIILGMGFSVAVILGINRNSATLYGEITMITIATYTFTKISVAIITSIKQRNTNSKTVKSINSIRYSEIAISILTMQQSMLVSFGEMEQQKSAIMNIFTGISIGIFILTLGIIILKNNRKEP